MEDFLDHGYSTVILHMEIVVIGADGISCSRRRSTEVRNAPALAMDLEVDSAAPARATWCSRPALLRGGQGDRDIVHAALAF